MFRHPDDRDYDDAFHPAQLSYVRQAATHGFSLMEFYDITPHVVPTVQLAYRPLVKYVNPLMRVLRGTVGLLLPEFVKKLERIQHYYMKRLNPRYFQRSIRYMILLFATDTRDISSVTETGETVLHAKNQGN